jgi:hypothetical protein
MLELMEAQNPDYKIREVVNCIPFRTGAEMIGATAGRIYLREQNKIFAVTMSDWQMRNLYEELGKVLNS